MVTGSIAQRIDIHCIGCSQQIVPVCKQVVRNIDDVLLLKPGPAGEPAAQCLGDVVRIGLGAMIKVIIADEGRFGSEIVGQQAIVTLRSHDIPVKVVAAGIRSPVAEVALGRHLPTRRIIKYDTQHVRGLVLGFLERRIIESRRHVFQLLVEIDAHIMRIAHIDQRTALAARKERTEQQRKQEGDKTFHRRPPFFLLTSSGRTSDTSTFVGPK